MAITPGGRVGDASPLAKPGYKGGRKLSDYEREVAHALMRKGHSKRDAIRMARGIIQRAAATGRWGRGRASGRVVAGAAASIAQRKAASASHKLSNEQSTDIDLAVLTAKKRKKLPKSEFALPGGRYPIHDRAHARNALSRVAQYGTPEEKRKVARAVKRRYGIGGGSRDFSRDFQELIDLTNWTPDIYEHGWKLKHGVSLKVLRNGKIEATYPDGSKKVNVDKRTRAAIRRGRIPATTESGGPATHASLQKSDTRRSLRAWKPGQHDAQVLRNSMKGPEGIDNTPDPTRTALIEYYRGRQDAVNLVVEQGGRFRPNSHATLSTNVTFRRGYKAGMSDADLARAHGLFKEDGTPDVGRLNEIRYSRSREKLHKAIVQDMFDKMVAGGAKKDGKILFMGGLPGAGKGYNLKKLKDPQIGQQSDYVVINPDDIKEEMARRGAIPEVPGATGLSPMERSTYVHEEASDVSKMLRDYAAKQGYNIAYDMTMHSPKSVHERLDALREKFGYKAPVNVLFVDVSRERSRKQANNRYRNGQLKLDEFGEGIGGRPVGSFAADLSSKKGNLSKNRDAFDELRSEGVFNGKGRVVQADGSYEDF